MKHVFNYLLIIIAISYLVRTESLQAQTVTDKKILNELGIGFITKESSLKMKKNSRGYYEMGLGLSVDQSCFKIYPQNIIPKIFQQMLVTGLSCMKKNAASENAARDLESFKKLLTNKSNLPKIECDKPLPDVAFAIGSSPGTSRNHPYIYLSKIGNEDFKLKPDFFKGVVFHELLHNIRYFHHPDDLEVTSACEECCFGEKKGESKTQACKICGGGFNDLKDPAYLRALIIWDASTYGRMLAEEAFGRGEVKSEMFQFAMKSFLLDINSSMKLKSAQAIVDKLSLGKFDEAEIFKLSQSESDNRTRFFIYRMMAIKARELNQINAETNYLAKAELARQKYIKH